MTRVVADANLKTKLAGCAELIEVCDESGTTLGYFHPTSAGAGARRDHPGSPFSAEELERRRREPGELTLAQILEALARQ